MAVPISILLGEFQWIASAGRFLFFGVLRKMKPELGHANPMETIPQGPCVLCLLQAVTRVDSEIFR
jgi:hypothetical protein